MELFKIYVQKTFYSKSTNETFFTSSFQCQVKQGVTTQHNSSTVTESNLHLFLIDCSETESGKEITMKVLFFQHAGSDVYQEHNRLPRTTTCDFFRFTSRFIGYVHASRHRHIALQLWNTSACHYVSRNNYCNSTTFINNKTHCCLYFPIDFLFSCFVFPFSLYEVIQMQVKYLSYYFNTFSLQ